MSTRQYARLVYEWVTAIELRREDYGTHSMRRTKAAMIYRATGNLRAVQILLEHTKIENTVRYLGVDVEDALILAERTEDSGPPVLFTDDPIGPATTLLKAVHLMKLRAAVLAVRALFQRNQSPTVVSSPPAAMMLSVGMSIRHPPPARA